MGETPTHLKEADLPVEDWKAHLRPDKKDTYIVFINLLRAAMLIIAFVLIALVVFSFGHRLSVALGFIIIALGALSVVIDLARHSHFGLSLAMLAVAILAGAVSVA